VWNSYFSDFLSRESPRQRNNCVISSYTLDRPFVAAILNIDMANVGRWAEVSQVAYTTYTDLSQPWERM
jgi:hypothetical protein